MKISRASTILVLFCAALGAEASVRDDVLEIAQLIESTYFDAARAKDIAERLREQSKQGSFDQHREPNDLAATLTDELRAIANFVRDQWDARGEHVTDVHDPRARVVWMRERRDGTHDRRHPRRARRSIGQ